MRTRSTLSALMLATLAAAAFSGCSAPSPTEGDASNAPTDTAQVTGPLNIACSQQEDFCQSITAAFSEATGTDATYVRLGSGEVLARLETTPGEFDIWSGGQAENHLIADDRGFIEAYISPNAEKLPAQYNDPDGIWSGFYTDSVGFCSNKAELKKLGVDAPTSWDDLLDPALKGVVSMPHPATAGVGYMAMYTVETLNDGDTDETVDYFQELNKNILQYSKSAATGTELTGRGEAAVAISLDSDCVKAKEAGYSDLVVTYPKEGTGYEVGAVSVLKNARNAPAAQAYMDWILTVDAQDLYAAVPSFAAPTLPDAERGETVPDQEKVDKVDWDLQDAADSRDALVGLFESDIASSATAQ